MVPWPHVDDRIAARMEDVASQLDAGLVPSEVRPGTGIVDSLTQAPRGGLPLRPNEAAVLSAAERAGTLSRALRQQAQARRTRAEMVRDVAAQLRYPLLLRPVTSFAFVMTGRISGRSPLASGFIVITVLVLVAVAIALFVKWVRRPTFDGDRVPGLSTLLRDMAEVPYLETLGGLYGAGVKLQEAHAEALRTVPVPFVKIRLAQAETLLQRGEPFALAMARARALGPESQQLVETGERTGTLEDALLRAAARRREVLQRRLGAVARTVSMVLGAAVFLFAAWVVIDFYIQYYGRVLG